MIMQFHGSICCEGVHGQEVLLKPNLRTGFGSLLAGRRLHCFVPNCGWQNSLHVKNLTFGQRKETPTNY